MKHIFFIDPLKKLDVKKDSSLLMALTSKKLKQESYLLFEEDFSLTNKGDQFLKVQNYEGSFSENDFKIQSFKTTDSCLIQIDSSVTLHMRLDPPFDMKYLRHLWALQETQVLTGAKIVNSANGILKYNEKLLAFRMFPQSEFTFIGRSCSNFLSFIKELNKRDVRELILKPLDLFQGIGIKKIAIKDIVNITLNEFESLLEEFGGMMVAQAFNQDIYQGEVRSIYYQGSELGSIIKRPKEGSFLANVAQGASYYEHSLNNAQKAICDQISLDLKGEGIDLVAFDMIGDKISEVNITCPGLLVEVSNAIGSNLTLKMFKES